MDRDDTVQVVGKRADGTEEVIGAAPMPPEMKAREIVREMLGPIDEDAGNNAAMALWCCEQLLEYIGKTQFTITPAPAAPAAQPTIPPSMKLVPVEDPRAMDDLAALVGRLAHSLKNAVPDSELPAQALDYLKRSRLQGSALREGGDHATHSQPFNSATQAQIAAVLLQQGTPTQKAEAVDWLNKNATGSANG